MLQIQVLPIYVCEKDSFITVRFPARAGIILFTIQSPCQWVLGSLSPTIRPAREADHSPPSSDAVKNAWRQYDPPKRWCTSLYGVGPRLTVMRI